MVLVRYGVSYLIEHPPPPNASATYLELDAHVVLWIYATLSDTMCDHVVGATTTFALWNKIRDYFLANRAARFMILNRKYRNLKQGDLSVSEYARQMKLLTDALAEIDRAVTEVDLTTQFLHGLDKRLETIRVVLGDQDLPFDTVLSRVVLAEESQEHRAAEESASAFALTNGGAPGAGSSTGGRAPSGRADRPSASAPAPSPQPPPHPGRGRGDRDGADRGGRGRGDNNGRGHGAPPLASPFTGYFAPYGMALPSPRSGWIPPNAAGVLGPRPGPLAQAYPLLPAPPAPTAPFYPYTPSSWEHAAMLNAAYSNGGFPSAPAPEWYFDSGASSHVTGNQGNLNQSSYSLKHVPSSILVGNGHHLPVTATGSTTLPPNDFRLHDVLVSPNVVTSLISVRHFTKDNSCSVEFYPCGFLVKDLRTRRVLMISVSTGDLYPFYGNKHAPPSAFTVSTSDLWHRRLGHPGAHSLSTLANDFLSSCVNIVTGKWIFRHKFNTDGSLARYKARWVVRGFTQQEGVDYDETFSPVVKPATIRVVLSLATSHSWPIHQLDVKNAFLHGDLKETVYCSQPAGFVDSAHPDHVCLLNKSLYGLKQAPRTWFLWFKSFLLSIGFCASKSDSSLFIRHHGSSIAYLLVYVDDIILTANTAATLDFIIASLKKEFFMTDLGELHHFLGINVTPNTSGLFLCQQQYTLEILDRANMLHCKPVSTPVDTTSKLSIHDGKPLSNPTYYRSLAGALQYLTLTRPDISYAVQQVCLFMHEPRDTHMQLVKRILRYLQGTSHYGIQLYKSSSHDLIAYTDADWAGCPDTRKSTSGFCVFLGNNIISWSSKRQPTVSRSSAEAEYRGVANCVAESCWLR
ncbi:uncharacterized protein [Aegilops tauschii subsp. strangulata]|uniref:uncharacterized protein n=1 Tax=Aegilops tauschii subsp. strangulata TaxID=200361 RepID=UPI003CC8CEF1